MLASGYGFDQLRAMFSGAPIISSYQGGPRLWQAWDGGFVQLKNGLAYVPGTDRRYYGAIQQQTQGGGPGDDWFGWLGGLFEKNYNGGVVYNGDAWYGSNFIGPGPSSDAYKLKHPKNPGQYLKPKDMVDAAAQLHDYYYYLLHADGVTGALFATRVGFADQILASQASQAFFGYFRGDTDPITGNAISPRTRDVAFDIMVSFGLIGGAKTGRP